MVSEITTKRAAGKFQLGLHSLVLRALIIGLVITSLVACDRFNSSPPKPDLSKVDLTHTVSRKGETLGLIAAWYTGSTEKWREIAEANPKLQVNKIRIGDQIVIPASLVVQREPMPAKYQPGVSATASSAKGSGQSKGTPKSTKSSDSKQRDRNDDDDNIDVVPPPASNKSTSSASSTEIPTSSRGPDSIGTGSSVATSSSSSSSSVGLIDEVLGDQMILSTPVPTIPSAVPGIPGGTKGAASSIANDDAFDFLEPADGPAVKAPSKTGTGATGAGNVSEIQPDGLNLGTDVGAGANPPPSGGVALPSASSSSAKSAGVKTRDELLEELLN